MTIKPPEELGKLTTPFSVSNQSVSLASLENVGGINLTNAFIDTRIELHNSDLVIDNSKTDALIVSLEELMHWSNSLEPSQTLETEVTDDESTQLKSLQDLFSGTPLKLEIGHEEVSTIIFE